MLHVCSASSPDAIGRAEAIGANKAVASSKRKFRLRSAAAIVHACVALTVVVVFAANARLLLASACSTSSKLRACQRVARGLPVLEPQRSGRAGAVGNARSGPVKSAGSPAAHSLEHCVPIVAGTRGRFQFCQFLGEPSSAKQCLWSASSECKLSGYLWIMAQHTESLSSFQSHSPTFNSTPKPRFGCRVFKRCRKQSLCQQNKLILICAITFHIR